MPWLFLIIIILTQYLPLKKDGFTYRISVLCWWRRAAAPNWGDYCIDVCAAPGGKSLHISEKLMGSGYVEARDISERKVKRMQENIERSSAINIRAMVKDATVYDPESYQRADIVLAERALLRSGSHWEEAGY